MEDIKIDTEFIKLGQLLKFAGVCTSGTEAKYLIIEGKVKLNDALEVQRGKKIYKGDIIKVNEKSIRVV